jgi:hypothetical protein
MTQSSKPEPDLGRDKYSRNGLPPETIIKINAGYNGPVQAVPTNVVRPTSPPPPKKKDK